MERKEMTLLLSIFHQLAAFNYNKAKDLAEKERSAVCGAGAGHALWPHFLACLAQLAAVEKLYMNLGLLNVKSFLRRENSVRASYEGLLTDLTDLELRAAGGAAQSNQGPRLLTVAGALGTLGSVGAISRPPSVWKENNCSKEGDVFSTLLRNLCSELLSFIRARICLINFYETCNNSAAVNNSSSSGGAGQGTGPLTLDYSDLASNIKDISINYADNLTQPLLSCLHDNLKLECDVLYRVFRGLWSLQHHSFLSTLLDLDAAHEALLHWQTSVTGRENKKYHFGSSFLKGPSLPALFQWLWQLKAASSVKFSLYCFHSLAPHITSQQDIRTVVARQPGDYVTKIIGFYRRYEASCVCVVLDTSGLPDYRGPGYHLHQPGPSLPPSPSLPFARLSPSHILQSGLKGGSGRSAIPPPPPPPPPPSQLTSRQGSGGGAAASQDKSFDRIFSYPLLAGLGSTEAAHDAVCWSSLVEFLGKSSDQLPPAKDGVRQIYDHQTGYTHYLCPVEPLITLAASYDCHRTERESVPVRAFFNELANLLNLGDVFANLKPR